MYLLTSHVIFASVNRRVDPSTRCCATGPATAPMRNNAVLSVWLSLSIYASQLLLCLTIAGIDIWSKDRSVATVDLQLSRFSKLLVVENETYNRPISLRSAQRGQLWDLEASSIWHRSHQIAVHWTECQFGSMCSQFGVPDTSRCLCIHRSSDLRGCKYKRYRWRSSMAYWRVEIWIRD